MDIKEQLPEMPEDALLDLFLSLPPINSIKTDFLSVDVRNVYQPGFVWIVVFRKSFIVPRVMVWELGSVSVFEEGGLGLSV